MCSPQGIRLTLLSTLLDLKRIKLDQVKKLNVTPASIKASHLSSCRCFDGNIVLYSFLMCPSAST